MKILHIVPSYLPAYSYGGPILSVHSMNKWLVKAGFDVTVYTTNINGEGRINVPLNREILIDGVKVNYFPVSFPFAWVYSRKLHRALAANAGSFDLIHITSVFLSASTLGAHYAEKFGKPYMVSPRGSLMKGPLGKNEFLKEVYLSLIEKKNLRKADAIHFTTEAEKDEYLAAGLPTKRSIIILNGLDMETLDKTVPKGIFRESFKIPPEKKIVLSLGRLNWKKGFDTLIPAFRKIVEEGSEAILVIVGGDEAGYKKTIDKLIAKNGLKIGRDVVFTGELLGDIKLAAFRESNLFVLPSYSENFGMVVVEAMYSGLPVVVTKDVGISPAIAGTGAGLAIEKDEDKLAQGILKILKDGSLAKGMGERGRLLVRENFSPLAVAREFSKIYNELKRNG